MNRSIFLPALLLICAVSTSAQAEGVAGQIGYMSGALVAQRTDGTIKVMGAKAEVFEGDVLVTAKESYAQVLMNDGTKMTLRPDSNLKIETYQFEKESPQADNAVFRLIKGGFRTVTGLIGKRGNPDAYKLRARGATLGIRGTDFTSRLCATQNCQDEGEAAKPVKPPVEQAKAVGRVMLIEGELAAEELGGRARKLVLGAPVYEGDTLRSSVKSYAVVAFRDGGRITLQENSVFLIEKYKYEKATSQESAALRLLKGGVRVVTGLIGRFNHDNYNFGVAGATIGIRGTGFDAWCNGPCTESANNPAASSEGLQYGPRNKHTLWMQYAQANMDGRQNDAGIPSPELEHYAEAALPADPMDGAGVYVWQGEVVFVARGSSFTVALNQAAMLARDTGRPVRIMEIPPGVLNNPAPKPDSVPVDIEKLFEESTSSGEPGLYVTVHDGQVILAQGDQKVDLGRGETGFANEQILTRLSTTPGFMGGDKNMDNLEKIGGSKSNVLQGGGCVVGP